MQIFSNERSYDRSHNRSYDMVRAFSRVAGRLSLAGTLTLLPLAGVLHAQTPNAAEGTAVVTATSKGEAPMVPQQQIQVSVDGKKVEPTLWKPYANGPVELVVLIDGSARTSLGRNLQELEDYIASLPPNVTVGVAYMQNGAAAFTGPMSKDHKAVAGQVHLPGGTPGSNASPYFCLSDLAKRWPAPRSEARREVLMISDGVDEYNLRYDPEDPYVHAAVTDSQRAGLVVYSIYFRDQGRLGRGFYETNAGQNYLTQLAEETGGNLYYEGLMNPVSFVPFLNDLTRRISSQYELDFPVKPEKKESYPSLKVKSEVKSVKLDAPEHVAVNGGQ
jgi:hypothetical protein